MSRLSQRSAVFLQEMGIGTQWVLRGAAEALAEQEPQADAPVQESAAQPLRAPAVAPEQPRPAQPSAPQAEAPPASARTAAPVRPAAVPSGEDTSWFDAAPVPAPAPPAARPPAPAAPQPRGDDDNAWFDAAPVPAPAAARPAPAQPQARSNDDTAWFDDLPAAPAPAQAPARARREGGVVTDEEIAAMDWPALQAAVKTCTRCNLCRTRVAAVPGTGDPQASWIMLGTMPNAEDESAIEPVAGERGVLLDNMLRALDLSTADGAYVTNLVKCRPSDDDGADRLPTADELAACRPYLDRELQLAQARVLVTLGQTAAKGLLGSAARGAIRSYNAAPVVATYHPSDLLRKPEDKAKAWSDLCLAKAAHAGRR